MQSRQILLLFALATAPPLIAEPMTLTDSTRQLRVGLNADILEDPSGKLTIRDVILPSAPWQKPIRSGLDFGFTNSVYWIRLSAKNHSTGSEWVLDATNPMLHYINVYKPDGHGDYAATHTGAMLPFSSREFAHKDFIFSLDLKPGEEKTYYVEIKSGATVNCDLQIWPYRALVFRLENEKFYLGLYFGIMLIMALYNLFLFFTVHDRSYLYYVLYVINLVFTMFIFDGLFFQYLMPDRPEVVNKLTNFFGGMNLFAISLFTAHFLNLRQYSAVVRYAVYLIAAGGLSQVFVGLSGNFQVALRIGVQTTLFGPIILLISCVVALKNGYRPARFYLLAWITLFALGMLSALAMLGIVTPSFITENGVRIGSAVEVLFISFALGDRINLLTRAKEEAERRVRDDLEYKVRERTADLNTALGTLDKQLDMARDIQRGILPKNFANWNGISLAAEFHPLEKVSGDYFDIIRDADELSLLIADVSGHGIPAALITMAAKDSFSNLLRSHLTPAEVFRRVNRELVERVKTRDYLTAFLLKIDDRNRVVYSNAGHHNAIHYRRHEHAVHLLDAPGFFIGINDGPTDMFQDGFVHLQPGDRIFLYTDGITETFDPDKNIFGEDRLIQLILDNADRSLADATGNVISQLKDFRASAPQRDDITLLALELSPVWDEFVDLYARGRALARTREHLSEAQAMLAEAHSLVPNYPPNLRLLSRIAFQLGEFDRAESYLLEYGHLKRRLTEVHGLLAKFYLRKGQYEKSISHAMDAARLNPVWLSNLRTLALIHLKLGDIQNAMIALEKARAVEPQNPGVNRLIAQCLEAQKN